MLFQNSSSFASIFGDFGKCLFGHLVESDIGRSQNSVSALSIENLVESSVLFLK